MDAAIKQKWVDALRSGQYEQAEGRLQIDGKFCCLGVLCELALVEGIVKKSVFNEQDGVLAYDGEANTLPFAVQAWAGLQEYGNRDTYRGSIAQRNDKGASFVAIADIIEEQL